jgi:hypothetical protein
MGTMTATGLMWAGVDEQYALTIATCIGLLFGIAWLFAEPEQP